MNLMVSLSVYFVECIGSPWSYVLNSCSWQ